MAKKDTAAQAPAKKKKNAVEAKPFTEAPRLKVKYTDEIVNQLKEKFGYENVMQIPKLEKVVINMGLGSEKDNPKGMESAVGRAEHHSRSEARCDQGQEERCKL